MKTISLVQVQFEDTKGVIRIRKSKKNRQHNNGQKKKGKRSNNDLQNIVYIQLYIQTSDLIPVSITTLINKAKKFKSELVK